MSVALLEVINDLSQPLAVRCKAVRELNERHQASAPRVVPYDSAELRGADARTIRRLLSLGHNLAEENLLALDAFTGPPEVGA